MEVVEHVPSVGTDDAQIFSEQADVSLSHRN